MVFLGIGKSGRLDTSYCDILGGGFKQFFFLTLMYGGKMIQFEDHILPTRNINIVYTYCVYIYIHLT